MRQAVLQLQVMRLILCVQFNYFKTVSNHRRPKRPTGPFNGRSLTVHNIASIAHQEMLYNGEYKIMYCKFYHVSFCENLQ